MRHYRGDGAPEPIGPPGRAVEFINLRRTDSEFNAVETVVRRLVNTDGINPSDLTLLTPRSQAQSIWKMGLSVGGLALNWKPTTPTTHRASHFLACATIHTFKGLESPVVIVTELEHAYHDTARQLEYVAYSRAKSHLVIIRRDL